MVDSARTPRLSTCANPKEKIFTDAMNKAYVEFLMRKARRWMGSALGPGILSRSICTIMTEQLFDCLYGAAVQTYLACGNYLYEEFSGENVGGASDQLNWPVHVLEVHAADGDELATMEMFIDWSEGRFSGENDPHPRCKLDPSVASDMLSIMLDEAAKRLVRFNSRRNGDNEQSFGERLARSISDVDERKLTVDKFRSILNESITHDNEPSLSLQLGRRLMDNMSIEQRVETLCRWAPYAPMYLPTLRSIATEPGFLVPELVMQGNRGDVLVELEHRDGPRARLAVREIGRLREMPRLAFQFAWRHPEREPCAMTVRSNLDWLTSGL